MQIFIHEKQNFMNEEKKPGDPIRYADCLERINEFKNKYPNEPHTYQIPLAKLKAMVSYLESQGADTFTHDNMIDSDGRIKPLYGGAKGRERISATEPQGEGWENKTFLNFTVSCPPLPPEECIRSVNNIDFI